LEVGLEGNREIGVGSSEKASYLDKGLPKDQTGKSGIRTQPVVAIFRSERKITTILHFTKSMEQYSDHPDSWIKQ
jgi:hypothetical protein